MWETDSSQMGWQVTGMQALPDVILNSNLLLLLSFICSASAMTPTLVGSQGSGQVSLVHRTNHVPRVQENCAPLWTCSTESPRSDWLCCPHQQLVCSISCCQKYMILTWFPSLESIEGDFLWTRLVLLTMKIWKKTIPQIQSTKIDHSSESE
jgi:hypothetical protein